jgi:hypothetical protein
MNIKALVGVLTLSCGAICLSATSGFAAGGGAHCQDVGGGVLTNFLDTYRGHLEWRHKRALSGFKSSASVGMSITCSIIG